MKSVMVKLLSLLLCVAMLLCSAPAAEAYTLGDPWQAELTALVENEDNRRYVQMMLDYYLRNDTRIQQSLKEGYCAMFLFEGCSDNMDTPEFSDLSYYRVAASCFVVKLDEEGIPQVIYFNDDCSTFPDRPLEYGAWQFDGFGEVGPATICDGTYELYSVKHMGAYEALHMRDSVDDGKLPAVYMFQEGFITADADMINIHTRTSNHTSGRGMWSAGCMLVGDGDFRQFSEMMDCTYYTVYERFAVGRKVGTVTINRQFLKDALYEMYQNTDAVDTILAHSRCILPEIYLQQCEDAQYFPETRPMQTKNALGLMSLPCSNYTDARSVQLTWLEKGQELTVTGSIGNTAGNTWFSVELEGISGYVYAGDLEPVPEGNWFTRLWDKLFG